MCLCVCDVRIGVSQEAQGHGIRDLQGWLNGTGERKKSRPWVGRRNNGVTHKLVGKPEVEAETLPYSLTLNSLCPVWNDGWMYLPLVIT